MPHWATIKNQNKSLGSGLKGRKQERGCGQAKI